MSIVLREMDYQINEKIFDGAIAIDDEQTGKLPVVIVCHGWEGRSSLQEEITRSLAAMGYLGFACDLFGKGIRGEVTGDNSELIAPFLQDRLLLRSRMVEIVRIAQALPEADPNKVAAIGFCFGGLCVLDLARSGIKLQAVASFHGLFNRPENIPIEPINAKVIAFHGWDDPFVPPADVVAFGKEMTEAGADWQVQAYGNTMHAFMAVGANRPDVGIQYNEKSAQRAWASFTSFLKEVFGD